jgi:Xaa-Pro aminopeptidase
MDHDGRQNRLRLEITNDDVDFLLVTHLPNIRYLCGFTGSSAALLISDRGSILFTDGRYRTQALEEVAAAKVVIGPKSPALAAAEWLSTRYKSSTPAFLALEPESISAGMRNRVVAALKGKLRLRSLPPVIERARMVKDTSEILCIRKAVKLGADLFNTARKRIRPGTTEVEVAAAMEYEARIAGAEGMSFPTILASGKRSAIVHGRASAARVPRRGFVVCDFGVILAGYCSDRTRTVHVGPPSKEARQLYESVLEAQSAAISAVRPGVTCAEVDGAARSVLKKRKLDRYFTHSTGHGLGLEIHEAPRLAVGQVQKLQTGMVVTIEPGVYIPGKYGVRIEDVVVVTSSGCEVLTPDDKDLVVI